MKRILVDMSAALLHHGHVRLLAKAKASGYVIVALATDEEVLKYKGFRPELNFEERKELLLSLKYVDEVIPAPWIIDQEFFNQTGADYLLFSGDSANTVSQVIKYERTPGISSDMLRERAVESIIEKRNSQRCFLTPGPGNLHPENLFDLAPAFSREDQKYSSIEKLVLERIQSLAGQDSIVAVPGLATTAIEVATTNFLSGKVAVVLSGYYSQRILQMLERKKEILQLSHLQGISYQEFLKEADSLEKFDWIVGVYTETANAFLADICELKRIANKQKASLMIDATGSINLEDNHELADVCMFSSCKGLGGLVGSGFITFNRQLLGHINPCAKEFVLDLSTYLEKKTTCPVHAIASLASISNKFSQLRARVHMSKKVFLERFRSHVKSNSNQPALCTKISTVFKLPPEIIPYQPRVIEPGCQVICHLFDQFPSNRQPGELYERFQME